MHYYVIVFDRSRRLLLRQEAFPTREAALAARFEAERDSALSGAEIVVLGARDEKDLHLTHRRYFQSLSELTAAG